nr:MAG TPA: hypothetical protein [Crassvirales sp.]DAV76845.1 MAG TPA: hypothetical protein [Caudoviricetes sp.]
MTTLMSHLNQQISSYFQVTLNMSLLNSHLLRRCLIIKRLLHTKIYSYRIQYATIMITSQRIINIHGRLNLRR